MSEHQPATWDIDQTHPQYHDDLVVGLSGLQDQEIGLSFIELGLIRNIQLEDGKVKVTMVLTTPFCPYGPEMISDTQKTVEKIMELPTTVELSTDFWSPAMMDPELNDSDWGLFP
ncbi:MAG: iron-sulfur cluster assembly protein [Anaerolineaceae bacterium]|jgi:metal-sulfur cluster biosynthetic enzyme|nr:iron-sulfur cluster assembly protein [Anaerolineaceae bacterium]MDD4042223.1 iron-sulfur cluster assembly protein [Anaerolineaceae bacterium]MDD4577983.1 iron-sulfur cluster assembly protein [Anaerolineaceae bacterium]